MGEAMFFKKAASYQRNLRYSEGFGIHSTETLATVALATVPQNFSFEKPSYHTFFRYRTPKKQV